MSKRVLMVDDQVMFLQALKTLLGLLAPQFTVDSSVNISDGLEMAASTQYDLVLLDWHLRDNDGPESMRRLREVGCTARVIVLSGDVGPVLIRRAIDDGAVGYVPKTYSSELLLAALEVVINGGVYLPPEALLDGRPYGGERAQDNGGLIDVQDRYPSLTPRQTEVYRAATRGLPNKLIARELGIAESTVKTHLAAVYSILGVANRTQAAFQASREGFRIV